MIKLAASASRVPFLLLQPQCSQGMAALAAVIPITELIAAKNTATKNMKPKMAPPGMLSKTAFMVMNSIPAPVEGE